MMNNSSVVFKNLVRQLAIASRTDDPVLILGEVGTGKRQSAVAIHRASLRASARFVTINCMGLSEDRFNLELCGAFSAGFEQNRKGSLYMAEGGTLYLHEVAELSLASQALLCRFLETGMFLPVNSFDEMNADVRLMASSAAKLESLVEVGRFRTDLFHLLNAITVHTPSLNDRLQDMPMLVESMLRDLGLEHHRRLSESALELLMLHKFNGNLLELKNILLRVLNNFSDEVVTGDQMNFAIRAGSQSSDVSFQLGLNQAQQNLGKVMQQEVAKLSVQPASGTVTQMSAPLALASESPGLSGSGVSGRGDIQSRIPQASTSPEELPVALLDQLPEFNKATTKVGSDAAAAQPSHARAIETAAPAPAVGATLATGKAPKAASAGPSAPGVFQPKSIKQQEIDYLKSLLDHCNGDKAMAAKLAGLNLRTFYRRLQILSE